MDENRVVNAMQNLLAAIHDMDTPRPPSEARASVEDFTRRQEEARAADTGKAKHALSEAEIRLRQGNQANMGTIPANVHSRRDEAPRERLRTHQSIAPSNPPAQPGHSLPEAFDRQEYANEGLHKIIGELEERLLNLTDPESKDAGAVQSPNGVGYSFRLNMAAQATEYASVRLRRLIDRLIV